MSIGEDFAASLAKANVQKARAARVQYLGGLTLAGLEREEEKDRARGFLDEPTQNLYRAIKTERANQDVAALKALEQPEAILTQYVRGLRDGLYTEKFQPVVEQLWTDSYRTLAQRSAGEKALGVAKGFAEGLAEAVPAIARGVGAAGAVATDLTPESVATAAAAAELGGAQSMRLLRGIPRLAEEDTTKEGLAKIFQRDLKELSDIEGVRRYEGKFLNDMAAKAPGLKSAVDNIRASLTPEDLATVDDLSNIFDPTELMPIGFVVSKVGKAFGVVARAGEKSHVMARTFKTAAEAAAEAERLGGTFNKVRKSVGEAMQRTGQRVATTQGGAPVSTFLGGLATGLPPETAFVAAAVASNLPRSVRRVAGTTLEAAGRTIAKDLPVPLERARLGLVEAGRQAFESGVEGLSGNAIFALGAETPEQAGGLLGVGAGLGGTMGGAQPGAQAIGGLFDITRNRFNPADVTPQVDRKKTSAYNEGLDDIHASAVSKLDNASANAIEDMRNTLVGPEGRLYIVETPEQAAKIASFYTGQTITPDMVESNGFSYQPEQTKQGVGVAVVFSGGEAFAHEPGHLIFKAMEVSTDPVIKGLAVEAKRIANQVLPQNSRRFNELRDYYNSLLPEGAKPIDGERVLEEFIVEHFTTAVGGAPLIKFGGDMPLSKKIYDIALTLGEKVGAYQPGLDLSGRSPVSSKALPIKPSPQLAKIVENMLAARQLDLSKNVPSELVNSVPAVPPVIAPEGVQNVEVITPPAPQAGFKKGDPIGNITNPQGELVFSGAKVWADSQGPNVRIEGVDASGNIVRADVPRTWLESKAGTAVPPVDVGTAVPVPATLTEQPAVPAPGSISGIPPKAPAPVQKPAPQATPNVRVTETQRQAVVKPTTEQVTENTRRLTEMANRGRTDQGYVQVNYLSAVADEKPADAAKRLEQRRLADAAEANTPNYQNPLRQVYEKVFAPYKPGFTVNTVFGFSFDKLVQNLDIVAGWLSEHPDVKIPYSSPTDPQIRADLRTYLTNSSNGYGGDGTRLVRPADTIPGTVTPENPNYTPVPLPRERAQFINLLMGLEPAQKMTAGEAYNYRFAKLNGLEPSLTEKGGPEVNPLRAQLKSAGFDSKLLNSVLENLRIDRIGANIVERPDIDLPVVEGAITRAGFMPAAPEGRRELVNVGLKVGDVVKLTKEDVIKAFADEGIALENVQVRESGTEPTVIASVRNADKAAIDRASNTLQQDAIAVYNPANDSGYLAGPRPENFGGKFLKEYFLMPSEEGPAMMPLSKESTERADPFVGQRIVSGWLLSDGQFRWGRNLADHEPLAQFLGFKSIEDLRDNHGAVRVWADGSEKLISFDPDRWNDMSGRQRSSIDDLAIETKAAIRDGRGNIIEDYRDGEAAFMPRATKPLEGSLGKGDIIFFHYSDTPNKGAIDPKYFGRSGVTGGREQAGLPRAFAYAEGSTLGQDAGLVDARKHYYEGRAPKGKIYDGVEDVLGYGEQANRAKADQMLIDNGFIGIYREGNDGRKQLEFFQPMDVVEAEKPASPQALAEEAMPILEPLALEEIDYAAQDREFARKKAAGEPLYMPAARGIHSQLEATLQAIPEKATRQQIEAALRDGVKERGQLIERPVKAEEMRDIVDQTGRSFEEFLKENPQASKQELLDFVQQNQIQVSETEVDPALYYRYQEPGGENYREILYTLPDNPDAKRAAQEKYKALVADGYPLTEALRMAEQMTPGFRSTHFADVRNYLAHARVNERVVPYTPERIAAIGQKLVDGMKVKSINSLGGGAPEIGVARGFITEQEAIAFSKANGFRNKYHDSIQPEGETMLFAEEIQSDLHQKARTEGYREALTPDEENALLEQQTVLNREYSAAVKADNVPEMERLEAEKQQLRDRFKRAKSSIPDAPFKKSWHEFVFKNLLRDAVEQGKDWLGWTTGDQQAARYDLSKQIGRLDYRKESDGKYWLRAVADRGQLIEGLHTPEEMEGIIGKEITQKIVRGEGESQAQFGGTFTSLKGLDLKVGGEGMKGFYDDILPRFADKYLKRYGIKTETVHFVDESKPQYRVLGSEERGYYLKNNDTEKVRPEVFKSREEAVALATKLADYPTMEVHAIRITPELRADVLEKGQPAYMPESPVKQAGMTTLDADTAAAFMPAPRVDLEDYIGRDVVTLTTDRLDVGFKEVGPAGAKKPTKKEAQGGRGFPLMYTGLGWAFSDPGSAKRFLTRLQATADGDTALVATAVLGEHNVLNSPFGQHAVAMAYRHAVDAGVLKLKDVDKSIRTIFSRAAASTLGDPDMQKVRSLEDFERATENWPFSFGATRELAKRLDAAELKIPAELRQAVGLDALSLARSISDPELAGLPNFTLVSLMEIPVNQTPVKDDVHFSYPYTVKGKLLGFLKDPVAADKLISSERVRKGGQLTAQPMMTVMPSLDLLKPTELNPDPQAVLANARLEYAKP